MTRHGSKHPTSERALSYFRRILLAAVVLLAACDGALPTSAWPIESDELLVPGVLEARSTDEKLETVDALLPVPEVLSQLDPGQCMLEFGTPSGKFKRYRRTLEDQLDDGSLEPFAVSYRVKDGKRLYRGTCNVPRTGWGAALDEISWAPRYGEIAGNGWDGVLALPQGFGGVVQRPLAWLPSTSDGQGQRPFDGRKMDYVNWDNYDHYDYCYYMADGNGNAVYVLYCGYNGSGDGCEPTQNIIGLGLTEECTDPGSGGGGNTGPFSPGYTTPPPTETQPDTVLLTPTCPVPPGAPPYDRAWCASVPVAGTQAAANQEAITAMAQIGGACGVLAAKAQSLLNQGLIRTFQRSQVNSGGAGFGNGIALLDRWFDYHETPFELDGKQVNLQFVIAHEIDEGFGRPHTYTFGDWYAETVNSVLCSGLESG